MSLETLGRYRVLEPIGSGGMSTVYAGEHTTLRRPVAIKILHQRLVADSVMARRMIGEAFTIAGLHHPGIVGVLDVGVSGDGRAYVVMERLIGETLNTRLRRGRLAESKVLVFGRQIASALAATHAAGVIHRDLKPENLYVVPDPDVPGGERVKVLDFGIALRDHDGRERTLTGVVLGTPSYMAPEQVDGSATADPRSDVFALGVVMYQMVTGVLPFTGANTEQMLVEQAFCAPTPAASLAPVSHALSTIIDKCLAKRPVDRFATMTDLAAELGRCGLPIPAATSAFESEDTNPDLPEPLDDEPIAAESFSTREKTARHVSRAPVAKARRWVAPLAIGAAMIVGILAAMVPRGRRAASAPAPAAAAAAAAAAEDNRQPATGNRQPGIGNRESATLAAAATKPARREPPPAARREPPAVRREAPAVRREPPAVAASESPRSRRKSSVRRSSSPERAVEKPAAPSQTQSPTPAGENRFAAVEPPTLY
jgi:serine/threonine-protein kinase